MNYEKEDWEVYICEVKYDKIDELKKVVSKFVDESFIDKFCKILCESYEYDEDEGYKFIHDNGLDESHVYSYTRQNEKLDEYLRKEEESLYISAYGE